MQLSKLIVKLLGFGLFLAQRDAEKAAKAQQKYRRQQDAKHKVLREEQYRLAAKAAKLSGEAATAAARASLGCNVINGNERDARCLAINLQHTIKTLKGE